MAGIDLTDLDNFADGFPPHLLELRRRAPAWWHEPTAHPQDQGGSWARKRSDRHTGVRRPVVELSRQ